MADLKEIKGLNIPARASDPTNPIAGEIWYNTTTNATKGRVFYNGVWSTGANINTGRSAGGSSGSSKTDGMFAGGIGSPSPTPGGQTNKSETELYDGTSWTEVNNINSTRRGQSSAGTSSTSALIFGGYLDPWTGATESWDGTNWTNVSGLSNARDAMGGAGTQTSALAVGGGQGISTTNSVESWNGSSWGSAPSVNTYRIRFAAEGDSNTSAIAWGGLTYTPGVGYTSYTTTESFDGTSWTVVNPTNYGGLSYTGTAGQSNTSAMSIGGSSPGDILNNNELWDGTCWTIGNTINVGRYHHGCGGTNTSALIFGGGAPGAGYPIDEGYIGTEEYNFGSATLTVSSS